MDSPTTDSPATAQPWQQAISIATAWHLSLTPPSRSPTKTPRRHSLPSPSSASPTISSLLKQLDALAYDLHTPTNSATPPPPPPAPKRHYRHSRTASCTLPPLEEEEEPVEVPLRKPLHYHSMPCLNSTKPEISTLPRTVSACSTASTSSSASISSTASSPSSRRPTLPHSSKRVADVTEYLPHHMMALLDAWERSETVTVLRAD